MEEPDASPMYSIRAVDRVCDLLDALRASKPGESLTSLAAIAEMPKSTTLRYLASLEARDYVSRDPESGLFRLGDVMHPERSRYFERLRARAMSHLLLARDGFGETVNLGVLDGAEVRYIAVVESQRSVRLSTPDGEKDFVHSTAIGKMALAQVDSLRQAAIAARLRYEKITDRTVASKTALLEEVQLSASRGYAIDDCENQPDGRCVAVSVTGLAVPAAVSVSAPANRMTLEQVPEAVTRLKRLAAVLESELRMVQI
jgi:IclR family acetate operon transcriptional repressor